MTLFLREEIFSQQQVERVLLGHFNAKDKSSKRTNHIPTCDVKMTIQIILQTNPEKNLFTI